MRILAVTCCTGGEELVKMTERCSEALQACCPKGVDLTVSIVTQGAARHVESNGVRANLAENQGFSIGMNTAIAEGLCYMKQPDWVLCFNNDLEFPDPDWLRKLLEIAVHPKEQIVVPATDRTALHKQPGPLNRDSFLAQEASAYCWLVPFKWCCHLHNTYGWWLFDHCFFAYGEDNWTAFLLAKQYGEKIFRIVPRSFVRHLRHQTSSVVRPDRRRSNRLLVDRLTAQLKYPKLRPDLKRWAQRYIAILSKRI